MIPTYSEYTTYAATLRYEGAPIQPYTESEWNSLSMSHKFGIGAAIRQAKS